MDRDNKGRFMKGHSLNKQYGFLIYTNARNQKISIAIEGKPAWNKGKTKETDSRINSKGNPNITKYSNLGARLGGLACAAKRKSGELPIPAAFGGLTKTSGKNIDALRKWRITHMDELIERARRIAPLGFKNLLKKAPYIEDGLNFQSKLELEIYRELKLTQLPIKHQIQVGRSFIDFCIDHTFIEVHPFRQKGTNLYDKMTYSEYYESRRAILDNNGYQDYGLFVVANKGDLNKLYAGLGNCALP